MKTYNEIIFKYKGKKKRINVKKLSLIGMFRGLMFRRKSFSDILFFDFSKFRSNSIHSIFVFFDFYAIWLDDKNNVIEIDKIKPFLFYFNPKKPSTKLIEIPINDINKALIEFFVGKRKI